MTGWRNRQGAAGSPLPPPHRGRRALWTAALCLALLASAGATAWALPSDPDLSLDGITFSSTRLGVGQTVTVRFVIRNAGAREFKDLGISPAFLHADVGELNAPTDDRGPAVLAEEWSRFVTLLPHGASSQQFRLRAEHVGTVNLGVMLTAELGRPIAVLPLGQLEVVAVVPSQGLTSLAPALAIIVGLLAASLVVVQLARRARRPSKRPTPGRARTRLLGR